MDAVNFNKRLKSISNSNRNTRIKELSSLLFYEELYDKLGIKLKDSAVLQTRDLDQIFNNLPLGDKINVLNYLLKIVFKLEKNKDNINDMFYSISKWYNIRWFLVIDLGFIFEFINLDRLITAMSRRVNDKRFLECLRNFITAESCLTDWNLDKNFSETPWENNPLSKTLFNIFMLDFDYFAKQISYQTEYDEDLTRQNIFYVRYKNKMIFGFDCEISTVQQFQTIIIQKLLDLFQITKYKLKYNITSSKSETNFLNYLIDCKVTVEYPRFKINPAVLEQYINHYHFGSYKTLESKHIEFLSNLTKKQIIEYYNRKLIPLGEYFKFCLNMKDLIGKCYLIISYSFAKTLGLKYKRSVNQLFTSNIILKRRDSSIWYIIDEETGTEIELVHPSKMSYIKLPTLLKLNPINDKYPL